MRVHDITAAFELEVARYTGAPYVVAVSSCTAALELAVARKMQKGDTITLPARTYPSVPQVVIKADGKVKFEDCWWQGKYRLAPLDVWDCAKQFTAGMYVLGQTQCVSFHVAKILGDTQGGAILTSNPEDAKWYRKMRFDGRNTNVPLCEDYDIEVGYHCYMSPDVAARLMLRMQAANFRMDNDDQGPDLEKEYPDLRKIKAFQCF